MLLLSASPEPARRDRAHPPYAYTASLFPNSGGSAPSQNEAAPFPQLGCSAPLTRSRTSSSQLGRGAHPHSTKSLPNLGTAAALLNINYSTLVVQRLPPPVPSSPPSLPQKLPLPHVPPRLSFRSLAASEASLCSGLWSLPSCPPPPSALGGVRGGCEGRSTPPPPQKLRPSIGWDPFSQGGVHPSVVGLTRGDPQAAPP
eukprot:CAMPEP_0118926516 /NCGR_PEP_ID=MMETSP1169-20130426/4186_1 /TAXON_ID=36882 /ORGANISM="Pyramimonas obovata, Strain CCMP722" /LENGTH=199 /DNA_ID=CAMNT_0006868079 /DNA_START=424 /DNA_END=1020 /DNA_ORIENTATION=-